MFQAAKDVCFWLVFFDFRHFLKCFDYCINQTKHTPKIKCYYICKFSGKENAKYFQNFYLCKSLILCKLKNILKKKCKNICEKLKHFFIFATLNRMKQQTKTKSNF